MPVNINAFLQTQYVRDFVRFVANVIQGDIPVNHGYLDRYLNRLNPNNRHGFEPQRLFNTLEDAFNGYYWPTPESSYNDNNAVLQDIQHSLRESLGNRDEPGLIQAIDRTLWWGAGNRNARLYTANISWIRQAALINNDAILTFIDNARNTFFPGGIFNEDAFTPNTLRSNAGFTKVYSLIFDDFIIYDSRVACALGLLVTRFLEQHNANDLPEYLRFFRMNAAGGDNRDASRDGIAFPLAHNHARHAKSNWIANEILRSAVDLLYNDGTNPSWIGDRQQAFRRIEAALFMLGKDIPNQNNHYQDNNIHPYEQELVTIIDGIDDDADSYIVYTLENNIPFIVQSNDECIIFKFGNGNQRTQAVPMNIINNCVNEFRKKGWFAISPGHVNCDERPAGSLGRWLCDQDIIVNIASYLAAYLCSENLAEYRRVGRAPGEIRIQ